MPRSCESGVLRSSLPLILKRGRKPHDPILGRCAHTWLGPTFEVTVISHTVNSPQPTIRALDQSSLVPEAGHSGPFSGPIWISSFSPPLAPIQRDHGRRTDTELIH